MTRPANTAAGVLILAVLKLVVKKITLNRFPQAMYIEFLVRKGTDTPQGSSPSGIQTAPVSLGIRNVAVSASNKVLKESKQSRPQIYDYTS